MAKKSSIWSAAGWMVLLSMLLFWLPALGPLIAGYVGGKKAGSAGSGFAAAVLPVVIIVGPLMLVMSGTGAASAGATSGPPILGALIGAVLGGGIALYLLASAFPLICGAIIGGTLSSNSTPERTARTSRSVGTRPRTSTRRRPDPNAVTEEFVSAIENSDKYKDQNKKTTKTESAPPGDRE